VLLTFWRMGLAVSLFGCLESEQLSAATQVGMMQQNLHQLKVLTTQLGSSTLLQLVLTCMQLRVCRGHGHGSF
jgi:hypothetical protein